MEKDFQIRETTVFLAQIYEKGEFPSAFGRFGTTPWTFELLLTQLFHLSGENLLVTKAYPVSCHQLLNWEEDALDEEEISLHHSSAYTINTIDSKKMEASWEGNAEVEWVEYDVNEDVFVAGNVTWDIANPMIQERHLEVKIEATAPFIPAHLKMSVEQTWQSTSL